MTDQLVQIKLAALWSGDLEKVLNLFCQCFLDDPFYTSSFPERETRSSRMRQAFRESIAYCLSTGLSLGMMDERGQLAAFLLCFDYSAARLEHPDLFRGIFGAQEGQPIPYNDQLHNHILRLNGNTLYLLSMAVAPEYRRMGLASGLIDTVIRSYPQFNLAGDVSNESSLSIYRERNFQVTDIYPGYYLILHSKSQKNSALSIGSQVKLAVPNTEFLSAHGIQFEILKARQLLVGYAAEEAFGLYYFRERAGSVASGVVVQLSYPMYLKFQRLINVSQYSELALGSCILYALNQDYTCKPLLNGNLEAILANRTTEWSLIPDVYISTPVQYLSHRPIQISREDSTANALIETLEFRTLCETGIPSQQAHVDDLSNIKARIKRHYLGKIQLQITDEVTQENYKGEIPLIGPPAFVDLYLALDQDSSCGVLTWYSLSSPFLLSHLLDNTIRNHLMVADGDKAVNFFDFISARFGLIKRGTPKSFVVIPKGKDCLTPEQIASLLVSETIYPDGESYGRLIDRDILSITEDSVGMGQYDRAFVCAHSNVVLQFSEELMGTISQRIADESITLFYIELILFEEAAIQIADQDIISLSTSITIHTPEEFLTQVDKINDDYSKTIDFWDIRVNYPTSQKSIAMLRTAFGIQERLEELKRNQEHLQTVFDIKCDIIDRADSKRMDTSLAVLSFLAVFSAWIDGYDYIATWNDTFSNHIIFILQRVLFVLVLITAGYAITHLFGNKLALMIRIRREKRRRKKKRKNRS